MSYSILIYNHGIEIPREIPFETNKIFEEYYLPFLNNDFEILSQIEYGYNLPVENFKNLITELETIKNNINPTDDFIIKRLDFVVTELKKVNLDEVDEIYLG